MKELKLKRLAFFIAILCLLFTSGCRVIPVTFPVKLTNGSTREVHMWIQSENIGPKNKLAPGTSRQTSYVMPDDYDQLATKQNTWDIRVSVGSNGNTEFTTVFTAQEESLLRVKFTGSSLVVY